MYSDLSKQCRPSWDAAERDISSGYTLFANHLAMFRHKYGKVEVSDNLGKIWYCNAKKKGF